MTDAAEQGMRVLEKEREYLALILYENKKDGLVRLHTIHPGGGIFTTQGSYRVADADGFGKLLLWATTKQLSLASTPKCFRS